MLLRRFRLFYYAIILLVMSLVIQHFYFRVNVLDDFYSSNDPHHKLSEYANNYCQNLVVIIEPEGRTASKTLDELDLLISTSRWWGNHPSMVYYFDGSIQFIYTIDELRSRINTIQKDDCFTVNKSDTESTELIRSLDKLATFDPLELYIYSY